MKKKTSGQESPALTLRQRMADALDMSKDILLNTVRIVAISNREITLENYRNILEYTSTCIRINTNPHTIKITGKNLEIRSITQEMLYVTGTIKSFEFQQS